MPDGRAAMTPEDRGREGAGTAYLARQVLTATPPRLVAMLHDRAIMALKEAVRAIAAGNIEGRWRANSRAVEILAHLLSTLDRVAGGAVADDLDRLYRYMLRRLAEVDLRNDAGAAEEVVRLLEPLRRSWHALAARAEADRPAPAPAAPAGEEMPAAAKLSLSV
jgi:flagellar protein FliS